MFQKFKEFIAPLQSSKALNLIILLLIVAAVPLTVFISQKQQDIRQRASGTISCETSSPEKIGEKPDPQKAKSVVEELDKANKELLDITNENILRTQSLSENGGLRESVFRRKNLFTETMRRNPDKALKEVLSDQNRNYLESKTQNCIEAKTGEEGELIVIIADFFKDKLSTTNYTLQTNQGKRIQIHPANLTQNLTSGMRVKIKEGYRLDNDFLFDASGSDNLTILEDTGSIRINAIKESGVPQIEKTLVIMANFKNTTQPELTKSMIDDYVFNQTSNYYYENSYGKLKIEGMSTGWQTLNIDQTCGITTVESEAVKKVDSFINFNEYNNGSIIIVAPWNSSCGWGGTALVGKMNLNTEDGSIKVAMVKIDTNMLIPPNSRPSVFAHEMGHGFTLGHANFWSCADVPATIDLSSCFYEYGDIYDVMGNSQAFFPQMNAVHKQKLGYFNSQNIKEILTSGIYVIEPIESLSTGIKTLKIPRNVDNYIYLEYRQPILSDSGFLTYGESNVFKGALIHIGNRYGSSLLLDGYIPSSEQAYAMMSGLEVGQSFTDPSSNTTIKVLSATSNALTVEVDLGSSVTPTPTLRPDQTITFVNLKPDGNTAVNNPVVFSGDMDDNVPWLGDRYLSLYLDGIKQQEGGLFYTRTSSSPTVIHQSTTSSQYTLSAGTHRWKVRISDQSGATFTDSKEILFTVSNPVTPTPTIPAKGIGFSNLYPNNSQVANPVKFSGTIVDSLSTIGYRYIYIYVDGSKVYNSYYYHSSSSSQNVPVSYTSTNNYGLGSHTWYVKTTDLFSNVLATSQKLNFTIGSSAPSPTQSFASPTPIPTGISTPTPTRVPTPTPTQPAIPTPTNSAISYPSLTITSPASYQYIKRGSSLTAKVSVSDSTGIKRVDYSFNGPILCTSSSSPYSCTFTVPTSLPPGYNTFKATAYNNLNLSTSKSLTVILY